MNDYIDGPAQVRCRYCLEWIENCKCVEYGLDSMDKNQQTKSTPNLDGNGETFRLGISRTKLNSSDKNADNINNTSEVKKC